MLSGKTGKQTGSRGGRSGGGGEGLVCLSNLLIFLNTVAKSYIDDPVPDSWKQVPQRDGGEMPMPPSPYTSIEVLFTQSYISISTLMPSIEVNVKLCTSKPYLHILQSDFFTGTPLFSFWY